jgi:predicted porin
VLKNKRFYLGYWLLIFCIQSSYGLDDNQSWTSVGFEKKLPYSFKLQFEQELRLENQLSTFKQTFSEFSLSYSVFKGFKIEIPFRYMTYKDKTKQRVSFSGSYKYSFKPVSLKYRIKLQRTYENGERSDDLIRNKFSIMYRLNKKIEPYVSGEFIQLDDAHNYLLDETRFSFGLTYELPRKNSMKIFYTLKNEDKTIGIFGLSYNFSL